MIGHSKKEPVGATPNSIPVVPGAEVVTKVGPFDCTCDNERYPDLQNAVKGDCGKLMNHYLIHGITENRDGSCQGGPFNADCYFDRDRDLQNAVGKDAGSSVCKGDSGYEPTGGDTGRETCTAKECGVAPEQAHSQPAFYGKISFPTVVGYS